MEIIKVENIGKKYRLDKTHSLRYTLDSKFRKKNKRELIALNDISFSVNKFENLGIIGHNGSGKSTLLKILTGIVNPDSGNALLKGSVGSLLEIGTGFHPELTGRENIFFNGSLLGMSRSEINTKFNEIVEFSGLLEFIDTPVKKYSSGMYVRLAFSVAAHLSFEILLIDEVLAVGDYEFQRKCIGKMDEITDSGRTILIVSHNLDLIQKLCNRCMWLDHGKLKAIGPVSEVINKYVGNQDVVNIENKIINNEIKLKSLFLGHGLKYIISKSEASIIFEITAEKDISDFMLIIILKNKFHERLGLFNSLRNHGRINLRKGLNLIELYMANWPLLSGDYFLDVSFLCNKIVLKNFDNLYKFTVLSKELNEPNRKYGVLMAHEWRVQN